MLYSSFSLNGTWKMDYCEETYLSHEPPVFEGAQIADAVPAYWEDMTDRFARADFFRRLRVNPEYGLWQYPIAGYCPDMALPNVMGNFFYRKSFLTHEITMPAVLHFGGVQNAVSVWLNGVFLERHEGYSAPFDVAIPQGVLREGENTLILSVSNSRLSGFDGQPIVGLTSRAACEYSGGIPGEVELRVYRSPLRDAVIRISEDCRSAAVSVEMTEAATLQWELLDGARRLDCGTAQGDFCINVESLERWSPENPRRYLLRLVCGDAVLEREFDVRRLTVDGVRLRLNGRPYYLRGVCEHCYYPETVNPCRDPAYYRGVIQRLKELGFNFIRFHTYVPTEEYLRAADELGMLMQIESPANTTVAEWREILRFCRSHPSVVIYCCGNELQLHDRFLAHLRICADAVHSDTDALFSPMSALRGLEYAFDKEEGGMAEVVREPKPHNPRRLAIAGEFSDLYNSYVSGHHSYDSMSCDVEAVDRWSAVYGKPRLSHEICIHGTYPDLRLKERYRGTRIGRYSGMLESIEQHLADKQLLERAPLYFKNSCEWQRRLRKYCFESVRRGENIAGYDFLGPIDTHWHTFGYDVGMMNEFYELKPGETLRRVRMYNADTVLLNDLGRKRNFASGELLSCRILTSCFGVEELTDATLTVRLTLDGETLRQMNLACGEIRGGGITTLTELRILLPTVTRPGAMKLCVALDCKGLVAENEWELYLYPRPVSSIPQGITVTEAIDEAELVRAMERGERVVLLGSAPFRANPLSFQIALAGRTTGNLATVIADHPLLAELPHEGFCGWQFEGLMEGGGAVLLEDDRVPYAPIIEVASSHKNAKRQAALFEFRMLAGRLLVCSLHFDERDPAAAWLRQRLLDYAASDRFAPACELDRETLHALTVCEAETSQTDANRAFNPNDKTEKQ